MKYAALLLLLPVLLTAQQKPKHHLGVQYAKAALLALKTIQGDDSAPQVRDGEIYADRHTAQVLNDADAEATSASEQSAQAALSTIYSAKLANNQQREIRRTQIELELEKDDSYIKVRSADGFSDVARATFVDPLMQKDMIIVAIKKREQACFSAMDALLRSRTFGKMPSICTSMGQAH